NILAAAALLNEAVGGVDIKDLESLTPALQAYAGFAPAKDRAVQALARQNFAYDVLLTLDRGVDDNGIRVPEVPIRWEDAFEIETLSILRAPFVRLDISRDRIELPDYAIEPQSETLVPNSAETREAQKSTRSTDYGPALWVTSPYHGSRSASISAVTIHTMQGSYAGSISWFQSNPFSVSAHYLIRSSDGQVTQMVREYRKAHHVGIHNSATLGIEHEGFVESGSSWYTTAMYNASSALTRHFCSRYGISCANAYSGPAHSGVVVLSTSIPIKGHQHFSSQTHVDPGIFWDWSRYHSLLNGGSGGGSGSTTILDSFESSEGHFDTSPTYSGSTVGISTSSTANRVCTIARNGSCSEQIKLVDDSSSSSNWAVRFLSGSGRPSSNTSLTRSGGRVGFWMYSGGSGISVGLGVDDSDGTERSVSKSIPANRWTFVEWRLDNSADWNPWFGGNGAISASSVTLDAIWIYRAQTSFNVFVYIDDVQYNR
ncbi:MAG: N-acetylmuramoyl-L-alanine amidase, partial [Wenzhouxiangellaceae bacterium]